MLAESSLLFDAAMRGGGVCLGGALTLREQEVARWLGAGYGVREVAGLLAIAPATVCKHRENIYRKLGVSNVNGLVLSLGV